MSALSDAERYASVSLHASAFNPDSISNLSKKKKKNTHPMFPKEDKNGLPSLSQASRYVYDILSFLLFRLSNHALKNSSASHNLFHPISRRFQYLFKLQHRGRALPSNLHYDMLLDGS